MLLADFHIHSTFSDGKLTIPEIVDLYGKNKFAVISITDHICEQSSSIGRFAHYLRYTLTEATFPLYIEILKSEAERAWSQYKMLLIPGVEITKNHLNYSRSAHVLALGIEQFISADQSVSQILEQIKVQNGFSIAAHPVPAKRAEVQTSFLWENKESLSSLIDAWEVASGPDLFTEVLSSQLAKVASSDLHVRRQLNSWKTILHCEKNKESVFNSIRQKQVDFVFFKDGYGIDFHSYYNHSSTASSVDDDRFVSYPWAFKQGAGTS